MPAKARPGKKGVYFELSESLIEAIDAHLRQRRPKIAKNAFAAYAFEELLAKEGAWPAHGGEDDQAAADQPRPSSASSKGRRGRAKS